MLLDKTDVKKTFSRLGMALSVFVIVPQLISGIIIGIAAVINPQIGESEIFITVLSYAVWYLLGTLIFKKLIKAIPDSNTDELPSEKITLKELGALALVSLGIMYVCSVVTTLLNLFISQVIGTSLIDAMSIFSSPADVIIKVIVGVILAPIFEELIFRKILYDKLIDFGAKTYILVSALAFSLFHMNFVQIIYPFCIGAFFAFIMYRTKDIKNTILLHSFMNLIAMILNILTYYGYPSENLFSTAASVISVLGIIIGANMWTYQIKGNQMYQGAIATENKKAVFLNAGMMIFFVIAAAFIIFSVLI